MIRKTFLQIKIINICFIYVLVACSIFAQSSSQTFIHGKERIVSVKFANEGKRLISADESGEIKFWDTQSSKLLWSVKFEIPKRMGDFTLIKIHSLEISPNGKSVAVAYIRDGVDRNIVDEKLGDTMKQRDVVYEPHIVFINIETGKIEKDITDKDKIFEDIIFSEDGKTLFVRTKFLKVGSPTTYYYFLGKLDIQSEKTSEIFRFDQDSYRLVFAPDKNIFAITDYNSLSKKEVIRLFDVSKKSSIFEIEHNFKIFKPAINFSSDNKFIVVAGQTQNGIGAEIWNIEKQEKVGEFSDKYKMRVTDVLFSDKRLILSGEKFKYQGNIPIRDMFIKDEGGRIYIFESDRAKHLKYKFKSSATCIDYSSDKSQLAIGLNNGAVKNLNVK